MIKAVVDIYDFEMRSPFFETEIEDWHHLGSRGAKEFLTSIRDGSGKFENYHTMGVPKRRLRGKCCMSLACHLVRVPPVVHKLRSSGRE